VDGEIGGRDFGRQFVALDPMETATVGENVSTHVVLTVLDDGKEVRRVWREARGENKGREGEKKDGMGIDDDFEIRAARQADEVKMWWEQTRPGLVRYWNMAETCLEREFVGMVVFLSLCLRNPHDEFNREMSSGDLRSAIPTSVTRFR
jgi:hypothetical protein